LKKITLADYRKDRYYARIVRATEDLLRERGFVAPIELLIRMELLSPESVEDWRRGRIPFLQRVIRCNLSKASRIVRILRIHAHDLDLKGSLTLTSLALSVARWVHSAAVTTFPEAPLISSLLRNLCLHTYLQRSLPGCCEPLLETGSSE
jgi:hypothetical protein